MNIAIVTPIWKMTHHVPRLLDSVLWQLRPDDLICLVCEREEYDALNGLLIQRGLSGHANISLTTRTTGQANCASARNYGVKRLVSGYDWVKFLDADDLLAPFALETFRAMAIPDGVHCVAGAQYKVVDGKLHGMGISNWKSIERVNPSVPSMAFVRRSAFDAVGGFDDRISFEEDWDFWLRLRRAYGIGCFAAVDWPVCYYWISQAERTAKRPSHQVEGMDVREYFAKTYGITPAR